MPFASKSLSASAALGLQKAASGFCRLPAHLHDGLNAQLRFELARRPHDADDHVEGVVLDEEFETLLESAPRAGHRDVHGVRFRREGGQKRRGFPDRAVGRRGKLKPGLGGGFQDDRRPAAGRGDDPHVPSLGRLRLAEERRDFEQVLQRFHPHDPVLPEEGVIDRVGPREGAGVRSGGPGADLRTADLEDNDRFSPLQCLDGDLPEQSRRCGAPRGRSRWHRYACP